MPPTDDLPLSLQLTAGTFWLLQSAMAVVTVLQAVRCLRGAGVSGNQGPSRVLVFLGFPATLGYVLSHYWPQPGWDLMQIVTPALVVSWFVVMQLDRPRAGRVLVDLGRMPMWDAGIILAVIVLLHYAGLMAMCWHADTWNVGPIRFFPAATLATIAVTFRLLVWGLDRTQIRECGIWARGRLYRWEFIASYQWSTGREQGCPDHRAAMLLLYLHPSNWLAGQGTVPVPEDRREDVDALLSGHAPQVHTICEHTSQGERFIGF